MGEMTQGKFIHGNAVLLFPVLTQPQGFQEGPQLWEEAPENSFPPPRTAGTLVEGIGECSGRAEGLSKCKKWQ